MSSWSFRSRSFDAAKLFSAVADDDYVGIGQHAIDAGAHQLRDVRYLALDVLLVCADESRQRNIAIVNREFESFSDQGFDQASPSAIRADRPCRL